MITNQLMERLFPTKGLNPQKYNLVRERDALINALNELLPVYAISNYLRVTAFLACCGIETDYFKTSKEYASGADYEGRRDLGNVIAGDGKRYPGKSLIQTTGRFNFWRVTVRFVKKLTGKDWSHPLAFSDFPAYLRTSDFQALMRESDRLGVNFLSHPEKLEEPRIAVEAACIFWQENNLNKYADEKRFKELNGIVNRGDKNKQPLHWAKRNELYSKCIRYVPTDFSFDIPQTAASSPANQVTSANYDDPTREPNSAEIASPVVLTPTDNSQPAPAPESALSAQASEKSKVKEFSEKYLKHCPQDTVKNILTVIAGRVFGSITTVWAFGLSGRIFLIIAGIIAVGCIAYALYYYSTRIFGFFCDIADSITGT